MSFDMYVCNMYMDTYPSKPLAQSKLTSEFLHDFVICCITFKQNFFSVKFLLNLNK